MEFITKLIEIGASLTCEDIDAIAGVRSLIDQMTDKKVAQAVRRNADDRLQRAIAQLSELKFMNLAVDAGIVHSLKTIPCLLANPWYAIHQA
jgi:hypothetical protein